MHLRQPGVIISISKNQDHTLESPIWPKPAVDRLLSNTGHRKIITLMSRMLTRSSSPTLAVLLFRALCGTGPASLRRLSFWVYGFLQQVRVPVAADLGRRGRRLARRSQDWSASWTLALELCVKRGTRTATASERLAWSVQLLQWAFLGCPASVSLPSSPVIQVR